MDNESTPALQTTDEVVVRLRRVKALVTDFDGVHTDNTVLVDETGRESVRCSRADGLGIDLLRAADIPVLILSRESNPVVAARAAKLRVEVIHDCLDKIGALRAWVSARGLQLADIAYVGNDVNDLECLEAAGLPFVPADAHTDARRAGLPLRMRGGEGAVREVADMILAAQRSI
jgi:N-acylneuraminate cytidylyltransferase